MPSERTATVKVLGTLQVLRENRGQETETEVSIPSCGCAASVLARELDLPLESIESVFVNHQMYCLDHCIQQGDKVAFVPKGFPHAASSRFGI